MKLTGFLFQATFVLGVVILLTGGVQWQVARKQRTNFNDAIYIEDAQNGTAILKFDVLADVPLHLSRPCSVQCARCAAHSTWRLAPTTHPPSCHMLQATARGCAYWWVKKTVVVNFSPSNSSSVRLLLVPCEVRGWMNAAAAQSVA